MASFQLPRMVVAALAVLVIFPAFFASAAEYMTEYIVGDSSGWTVGVDYEAWAEGKKFFVGDTLVFNYEEGYHSVIKVNGTGFRECLVSPNNGTLTSGSDRVTLATPGNKWYICGAANHCNDYSQKLKITVLPRENYDMPTPAPAPMATPRKWGPAPQMPVVPAPWSSEHKSEEYYSPPSHAPWSSAPPAAPWAPIPAPAWLEPSMPPSDGSNYMAPAPAPEAPVEAPYY